MISYLQWYEADWYKKTFDYSYFVRKFVGKDGWIELGEYATRADAEAFYDECLELDRFGDALKADIVKRSIHKQDSDYIIDETVEVRRFR